MSNEAIGSGVVLNPSVVYKPTEQTENQLVFDIRNGFLKAKWFEGLRMNYTANILKYTGSCTALIAVDDDDNTQYVTYDQLYDEVKVYIKALKDAGVKKGDVIACYVPNKIEPVFAFLATAAIGATWFGGLPIIGSKGIIARFQQVNPKILFTSGNFTFEGTEIRMDLKLPEIVESLPSLEKVVYIPSKTIGNTEDTSRIPKCVLISKFLEDARRAFESDSSEIEFAQVAFDHSLCISFTSGTTGAPKGLIHSHGVLLAALRDYGIMQDCTKEDILFNSSPAGWISWHMLVNCLHLGLTLVMYEGNAFDKSSTRYWDMVDKFGITSSYILSSTVEVMEQNGLIPMEGFPGLVDSVCVSQFNSSMDERVVLFVKMNPGSALTADIENDIKRTIEHHLSIEHVPAIILQTPDIPYTLTGKKLNGLVKKLINKRPVKNAAIVVNPSSMDFFTTVDLGTF